MRLGNKEFSPTNKHFCGRFLGAPWCYFSSMEKYGYAILYSHVCEFLRQDVRQCLCRLLEIPQRLSVRSVEKYNDGIFVK